MPQKSRYTAERKEQLVTDYMNGKMSPSDFERIYGSKPRVLKDWMRLYKTRGVKGLTPATQIRKYAPETKLSAVCDYLDGKGSIDDLCTKYDISDRKILRRWIKRYNSHGDFNQPNTGGSIYMVKGRVTTLEERIEIVSHCIANNKDYGKTIGQYGISYQQIYVWVRKYEKDGADGLTDRRGKRKDEISMTEVEKLRAQLKLKESENYRLQMENDLLKKLEALERGWDKD
jgi:transposase-like protein